MAKQRFEQRKPHLNIGEIGNKSTKKDSGLFAEAIKFFTENGQRYNQEVLLGLIREHGLEEGLRKCKQMVAHTESISAAIDNIDDTKESSRTR